MTAPMNEIEPKPLLYHYTRNERAIENIFHTKTLRLSPLANDQ